MTQGLTQAIPVEQLHNETHQQHITTHIKLVSWLRWCKDV